MEAEIIKHEFRDGHNCLSVLLDTERKIPEPAEEPVVLTNAEGGGGALDNNNMVFSGAVKDTRPLVPDPAHTITYEWGADVPLDVVLQETKLLVADEQRRRYGAQEPKKSLVGTSL